MRNLLRIAAAMFILTALLAPLAPVLAQEKVAVEERSGVVLRKLGSNTIIVRNDKGEIKKFMNLPADVSLMIDGKPATIEDIKEGTRYTAIRYQTTQPAVTLTEAELAAIPSQAAPAAAPAPAVAPAPKPAPAAEWASTPAPTPARLPATGSALPMLTWFGCGLLALGLALGGLLRK